MLTVEWQRIDTQDSLLGEKKIERFVEIGPSNTLTGLAKQTIELKYRDHDTALSIQRRLLNLKTSENDIYYTTVESADTSKQVSTAQDPMPEPAATPPEPSTSLPDQSGPSSKVIATVEDVPVKVEDIVLTIIAQKLKKSIGDISLSSTIKTLVGGKRSIKPIAPKIKLS